MVVPALHPRLKTWMDLSEALFVAAETGWRRAHVALRPRRQASYTTRRPGAESPMWNVCATLLRQQLKPRGAKTQLARYLGIPRQRLNDYLQGKSRLPDAELTLRMLHWLSETRAGRNPAV
jgi:transcriptional regulator with XRE-family HTH domain